MELLNDYFWPKEIDNVAAFLTNDNPTILKRLQIFRVAAIVIFICIYIHSYFEMTNEYIRLLIAYTHWGVFLTMATFIFSAIGCGVQFEDSSHFVHKAAFVLFEVSWTSEVVITIMFWAVIAIMDSGKLKEVSYSSVLHLLECHLVPIILLSVDFAFNKMEFIPSHGFLIAAVPTAYSFVSMLFSLKYDLHTYSILTWKDYKTFLGVALVAFFFVMGFMCGYLIGKYKREPKLLFSNIDEKIIWPESKDLTFEPKLEEEYGTFRMYNG